MKKGIQFNLYAMKNHFLEIFVKLHISQRIDQFFF